MERSGVEWTCGEWSGVKCTQSTESLINKVYETQKQESKKGDFVHHTKEDLKEIGLKLKETEIKKYTKSKWNKTVNELIENTALKDLLKENEAETKTKHL